MKKIILCMLFVVTAFGFSAEIKLGNQYNKDSVWSICSAGESLKDCKVIFKGNPAKELKVYEAEEGDPFGMTIDYKKIMILTTGGNDLKIIENKSAAVPNQSGASVLDKSLAGVDSIAVMSDNSDVAALVETTEYKNFKKSGKNVFYYNLIFTDHKAVDAGGFN